jgi:hypothetical protein
VCVVHALRETGQLRSNAPARRVRTLRPRNTAWGETGRLGSWVCGLSLTSEELTKLDKVSALPAEYPGWMFERQGAGRVPKPFERKK